ncbi:MAG TPA: aconitase X catalytic domain-containing protein [Anaerolineae bacterium]|nr:aconitase X catalytic domain-containing protein [Anaerolineae bacterium]
MLRLSAKDQALLAGDSGPGVRKAMEIVVALGRIYGAERLVPVSSVQVAGVSYRNLGEAGLEFLREWADQGARARVPTTLNPAGIDLRAWRELGFSESFARRQLAVIEAYRRLGVRTTCTCTPYLVGNVPRVGEHVAWAESSAVSYANSVLGARTNREGGPSALAAAIAGRTAAYGLHLDQNRRATLRVAVRCPVRTLSDFGALGHLVGRAARNCVPYLVFEGREDACSGVALKALGAAMAASGAVALYHVAGCTPEADRPDILASDHETLVVDDLRPAYAALNSGALENENRIDLVWFGCPHAGLEEMAEVVRLLDGRRVRTALWITAAREMRERAAAEGLVAAVEASGGRVIADMCAVVAPMQELGFRTLATPSAKGATYLPSYAGLRVRYGTVEQCVEAAVTGVWSA